MIRLLIAANEAAMFRDFLNPFAAHFRAKGWKVDAMACDAEGAADCSGIYDEQWNVPWSRRPFAPSNVLRAPAAVRRIALQGDYDLVHVHTPIPAFITRCALRRIRLQGRPRVIYTAHGFHFHDRGGALRNGIFRSLEKVAGAWTDYLVVINRGDEQAARRFGIVPPERLWHMPGIGIDLDRYRADAIGPAEVARVRRELNLGEREQMLLMIAEFTPGKRHRDAIRAFAKLGGHSACLALAGYGPLMEQTRALAREYGIAERVRFLGYRRDIPALIRTAAAVVLPSDREGLPRSVMEALAMQTPVIGTDVRGTRDLLAGGFGVLVPVGDIDALADAMRWAVRCPAEANEMARRGRERMRGYDLREIIGMHEELYARALAPMVGSRGFAWESVGTA